MRQWWILNLQHKEQDFLIKKNIRCTNIYICTCSTKTWLILFHEKSKMLFFAIMIIDRGEHLNLEIFYWLSYFILFLEITWAIFGYELCNPFLRINFWNHILSITTLGHLPSSHQLPPPLVNCMWQFCVSISPLRSPIHKLPALYTSLQRGLKAFIMLL